MPSISKFFQNHHPAPPKTRVVTWIRFSNGPISSLLDERWANSVVLPHYKVGFSGEDPLPVSRCANALQQSVYKARLYLFEMARTRKTRLELDGKDRKLDEVFAAFEGELSKNDPHAQICFTSADRRRDFHNTAGKVPETLQALAEVALKVSMANKAGVDEEAKTIATLLRLDKDFRMDVLEPLKEAFISKNTPDHARLEQATKQISKEATPTCEKYLERYLEAWGSLKGSKEWKDAVKVDNQINEFQKQARRYDGYWDDPLLREEHNRYSDRDKPSRIIAALEAFIVKQK